MRQTEPGPVVFAGDGPPVVLLVGPLARAGAYRRLTDRLARAHRVAAVELPVRELWGVDEAADWVGDCLDALDGEPVTLVGHSLSGPVAVAAAARHPGLVARLVLADSFGAGPVTLREAAVGRAADLVCGELFTSLGRWRHLAGNALRHRGRLVRQARALAAADVRWHAARVAAPTLLAWGGGDHTTPPAAADEFARYLSEPTRYVAAGGGHHWPTDRAGEFADVVEWFTATAVPAGSSDSWAAVPAACLAAA